MPENKYLHPIKLNGITIPNNFWLAPLAGYSMKALRVFCAKYGAGFSVTEMISLEGLVRGDKKTWVYADIAGEDWTAVQLFGKNEPDKYYKASRMLQERIGAKIIDVNFGCPVKKVIRTGSGSAHLKNPSGMSDIIKALKDSGAVTSAKIRSGFDSVTIEESMEALNRAQADIITVHARLATQFYNGHADWSVIARAREMTDGILIANGDVKTPEDAKAMLDQTRADGVMIGRQAIGSPNIFSQILSYFETGTYIKPNLETVKEMMLDFAELFVRLDKKDDIIPIRSALIQYVRSFSNSREIRHRLSIIKTVKELSDTLKEW